MIVKRLLCPQRLRRVPERFSWVDQRLVRDGHISSCGLEALGLYLLLVTVADAEGLSYYADRTAARLLSLDEPSLRKARQELVAVGLIAYQEPLYQVLSLDREHSAGLSFRRAERCLSIGEALAPATGGK
jgi:hypothetical protein